MLIRSILVGFVVAALGTTPWAVLVSLNLKFGSNFPWSVPITAAYLWAFWRYMNGAWWPDSTARFRKTHCRVNKLPDDVWGAAILAGIAGLIFIVLLQAVLNRVVRLPLKAPEDVSHIPMLTLFFFAAMSALVAGVAEEIGFRGYMQLPIEKTHGPLIAILVVGVSFGLAHFSHPEVKVALMPYYITVAAVYGGLAYLADSILPSLVLHAVGNFLSSLSLFTSPSISKVPVASRALIWDTGTDTSFWASCLGALLALILAILAYRMLALVVRKHRNPKASKINSTVDV